MNACAFFGSRAWNSAEEKEALRDIILLLVEKYAVTQFYSGGRGIFDETAAMLVGEIREKYPHIKNTLILSYIPNQCFLCFFIIITLKKHFVKVKSDNLLHKFLVLSRAT